MHRVLVLGGRGMLGWMVVRLLRQNKDFAVSYTSRDHDHGFFYDIVSGPAELRQILQQHGHFDYVVNCIGILNRDIDIQIPTSVRYAILVNSLFPYALADLAQEFEMRVIHISTDGVFSGDSSEPYLETAPCDSADIYGKTKSLGEIHAPKFLTIRCSTIGPDPINHKGLLEWFLAQPEHSLVEGYTNHLWNGVTTLQFAELCRQIFQTNAFEEIWGESPIHHFCPNNSISKYQLLEVFKAVLKKQITIRPTQNSVAMNRVLATQYQSLSTLFGHNFDIHLAVQELKGCYFN